MRKSIRSDRDLYNWLFEQEEKAAAGGDAAAKDASAPDPLTAEKIQKLWSMPYEQFVQELKKVAKDPKLHAFLAAGKKDGDPTDESVAVKPTTIAGSALQPTQSEIDLGGSVGYAFKNPKVIANFYAGGAWKGGDPIITAGGKYVIDGHHRWSAAMVFNPEIQLDCIDINVPDPEMALKMTQAAIAVTKKNLPTQGVKEGMNLYQMGFDQIVSALINAGSGVTMLPSVVDALKGKLVVSATPEELTKAKEIFAKAGGAKRAQAAPEKSETGAGPENLDFGGMGGGFLTEAVVGEAGGDALPEAAASLAHNCKALPPAGKFPRPIMPQTGLGDGGPGPEGLGTALQSGDINSKPGFDIQTESRIRKIHLPGIRRRW